MDNDILTIMRRELGDAVSTDPDVLALMRSDQSGHVSEGVPLMLVTARTIADVQAPCGSPSSLGYPSCRGEPAPAWPAARSLRPAKSYSPPWP